jgi:hypothetical protein
MSSTKTTFDVRTDKNFEVDEIVFANPLCKQETDSIAHSIIQPSVYKGMVSIKDHEAFVLVQDKQHALNLIKALEKAIELKWLV